jgi:hypothetical protein
MTVRALIVWFLILVLAILNGANRQGLLIPWLGEQVGHVISTVLLSLFVLVASWFLIPWVRPGSARDAWFIGVFWVLLTLGFEFLAGHYLFRSSWEKLFADYNLAAGRIWILVLLTTLLAPVVVLTVRRPTP